MTAEDARAFEEAARRRHKQSGGNSHTTNAPRAPLPFCRGEDYRQAPGRKMVIKRLMGAGDLSVTYGPPKSGKSFLMTSCALAVAEGADQWFGFRIRRPGLVMYLIMEGAGGFPNRLQAWSTQHNRPVSDNFVWVAVRLQFLAEPTVDAAAGDVARVRELVRALERESGLPVVLIVVDTVARAMTGGDENSVQDMGRFLEQCAVLQELPSRPHVNVVHHENAAGTKPRGSTALIGAGDTFLRVDPGAGTNTRAWSVEWAKDDADGRRHGFELRVVSLGPDEDGDDVTSCVVVATEAAAEPAARREVQLTDRQRVVLDCLAAALADHGEAAPLARDIPSDARVVRLERWCATTLRYLPGDAPDWRKRESFLRIVEALQRKGFVRHADGWCWKP